MTSGCKEMEECSGGKKEKAFWNDRKIPSTIIWLEHSRKTPPLRRAPRTVTKAELKTHKTADDCWVRIKDDVYDVTEYLNWHPGGADIILERAGKNITKDFLRAHPWINPGQILSKYKVGKILDE